MILIHPFIMIALVKNRGTSIHDHIAKIPCILQRRHRRGTLRWRNSDIQVSDISGWLGSRHWWKSRRGIGWWVPPFLPTLGPRWSSWWWNLMSFSCHSCDTTTAGRQLQRTWRLPWFLHPRFCAAKQPHRWPARKLGSPPVPGASCEDTRPSWVDTRNQPAPPKCLQCPG